MYTILILNQRVFAHESKDVWKQTAEMLQQSSWGSSMKFGFEPL